MSFVFIIVVSLIFGYLLWFVGRIARKQLTINEDNKLLLNLINIAFGSSIFLITVNLLGNILKDFNWALALTSGLILLVIAWKLKDFIEVSGGIVSFFLQNKLITFLKQNADRYFWILLGVINFIYGLTAFSTTKLDRFGLGNAHVFNINHLLAGNYPPKYSFLPNVVQKYHYGSDILGAVVSKFSNTHPEIVLDVLLLMFLNLSILTLYALTIKFLNTNPVNKYLVPFAAFLAWGPITNLFTKNPTETIPTNFLEKVNYLTQTRLNDAAEWSGLVLHWYFAPPIGIGIFFFLIAIYLLFRFLEGERNLKYSIILGVYLSSFVIIDFSKYVILAIAILLYVLFSKQIEEILTTKQTAFFKYLSILLALFIALGFVHGNYLAIGKEYLPLISFYDLGNNNIDKNFGPFRSNLILLLIYAFGFFQACKLKQNWIIFILHFFLSSLLIANFTSAPSRDSGKVIISGNLLGAFALPLVIDFIRLKLSIYEKNKLMVFNSVLFFILCFSSIMYWAWAGNEPLFKYESKGFNYKGLQKFPFDEKQEEIEFIKYLRSKKLKDQGILTEPQYAEIFSINTGLFNTLLPITFSEYPVKQETLKQFNTSYLTTFYPTSLSYDKNNWLTQKIKWIYISPKFFKFLMPPEARIRILNTYLNKSAKFSLSNNKFTDPSNLKELYEINPLFLSSKLSENYADLLENFISSTKNEQSPWYLKKIAECPYLGIYNAMSNDFDGDKMADLAFFDRPNKRWLIIHGNNKLEEVDLTKNILTNFLDSHLYIPLPSDYDGDSKTDISLFDRTTAVWQILRSTTQQVTPTSWGGGIGEIPLPTDVDGDFKADISVYDSSEYSRWPTQLSSLNYSFSDMHFQTTYKDIPLYSDIDGDKKADYVIYDSSQGLFTIFLSTKNFTQQQPLKALIGGNNGRAVLADYDGDGKVDPAIWTPETGKWEILFAKDLLINANDGISTQLPFIGCGVQPLGNEVAKITQCNPKTIILGKAGDIPMPGDYNGDGKADIAVYRMSTSKLIINYPNGRKVLDLLKYRNYEPAWFIGI